MQVLLTDVRTGLPAGWWSSFIQWIKGQFRFHVTAEWSDEPQGYVFDPIPNPKRYLVIKFGFGMLQATVSLDLK